MSDISIKILELLTSKVCHDLISPIGAVNNGVEFVQEMGLEDSGDAFDLIAFSAQQASAKLKAYRMAYGAGGADNSIKPEDIHEAIEDMVGPEKKITQEWEPDPLMGLSPKTGERPEGFAKIIICAFLLAMDSMPKGGTLSLTAQDEHTIILTAKGEDCSYREGAQDAHSLSMPEDALEPKYIHAYTMGLLTNTYGFKADLQTPGDNEIAIHIAFPEK